MCCNILDLVTTIIILYFLVPILGMNGYIFSIFVSEILNFTISSFQLRKRIPFKLSLKRYIILPIIASIISYAITCMFSFSFNNFVWYIVAKLLLFVVAYLLLLFGFSILKQH